MKYSISALGDLAAQFVILSLIAFGGANAVLPEMHRQAVDLHHWMSDSEFANLFAIAQAAPGPNVMIATLVGWRVAGVAGGLVATLAMCAPSCLLAYGAARVWEQHRRASWRAAFGAGLAPVTVGLVVSSAWLLALAADRNARLAAATLAAAAISYFWRFNPLWLLGGAALIGYAGAFG